MEIYGIYTIRLDDVYWSIRYTFSGLNRFVVLVSTHFFCEDKKINEFHTLSLFHVYQFIFFLPPAGSYIICSSDDDHSEKKLLLQVWMHWKNWNVQKKINPFNFNLVSVACGYRPRSASVAVMWFDMRERECKMEHCKPFISSFGCTTTIIITKRTKGIG